VSPNVEVAIQQDHFLFSESSLSLQGNMQSMQLFMCIGHCHHSKYSECSDRQHFESVDDVHGKGTDIVIMDCYRFGHCGDTTFRTLKG
jgi:hypothetical protein